MRLSALRIRKFYLTAVSMILLHTLPGPVLAEVSYKSPEFRIKLEAALNQRRLRDAIKMLDSAIAENPSSWLFYAMRGDLYSDLKEYDRAMKDFSKSIGLGPRSPSVYFARGLCFGRMGRWQESISDISWYMKFRPNDPEAYLIRSCGYLGIEDRKQAANDIAKAYSLEPNNERVKKTKALFASLAPARIEVPEKNGDNAKAAYLHEAALAKFEQGKLQEAIEMFDESIAANPSMAVAYMNRGSAYDDSKESEKALLDYGKAISLDPNLAQAYYNRGVCLARIGHFQEALSDFNEDLRLRPDHKEAYSARAGCYAILGKKDLADTDTEKSQKLASFAKNSLSPVPVTYDDFIRGSRIKTNSANLDTGTKIISELQKQKANQTIANISAMLATKKNDTEILFLRVQAYYDLGKYDLAVQDLSQILASHPNNEQALIARSSCYLNQCHYKAAIADTDKLLAINPNDIATLRFRAQLKISDNNPKDALSDLNKVLAINPKEGRSLGTRAAVLQVLHDDDGALKDLTELLKLTPNESLILYERGSILYRQNKFDAALNDVDKCLSINPKNASAQTLQASIYAKLKQSSKSSENLERTLKPAASEGTLNLAKSTMIFGEQEQQKIAMSDLLKTIEHKDEVLALPAAVTSSAPASTMVQKPEWTQNYLADLERRLGKQISLEPVGAEELIAHFQLHSGGEISNIQINGKDKVISESLQNKLRTIIQHGAPYKTFNQAQQIAVIVSFKGGEIHALLE